MTTLSVPIPAELEGFINDQVKSRRSPNKAAVVRYALHRLAEDEAVQAVFTAEREVAEGKGLHGDMMLLVKKIRS